MVQRVAVIGGGAAGLCALRHLTARPNLFIAVGFEQNSRVGGTWIYTDRTGTDEHGLPVHSSMYKNLRTNLPKEVMSFPDFPFRKDLPSFIGHEDVLQYLVDYAKHFDLNKFIKFQTCVERVNPTKNSSGADVTWQVSYKDVHCYSQPTTENFDAVIVCNGHYAEPLLPNLPGLEKFQGQVMHSHNYRTPDVYKDMRVICLGAASSGQDISLDLAPMAKQVYLSHNKPPLETVLPDNLHQAPGIKAVTEKTVIFKNGEEVEIDAIMFCTGYRYTFPFLTEECHLSVDQEERITPLYKHIVHTEFPTLSFIGICKTICPFPQFNNQVQFVISSLDKSLKLPSKQDMDEEIERDFQHRLSEGLPPRHAHTMGPRQWAYNDSLSEAANFEPVPKAVMLLYDEVHRYRVKNLPSYKSLNFEITGLDTFRKIES